MNMYGETFSAEVHWPGGYEPLGDFDTLEAAWAAIDAYPKEVRGHVRVYDAGGCEIDTIGAG